jgi:hypothetical protein
MLSLVVDPTIIYKADLHFQQGAFPGEAAYHPANPDFLRD